MKLPILALVPLLAFSASAGEKSLFDGKSLDGWTGLEGIWSVEDGAITGRTTAEKPVKGNTFLIWKGGTATDFELTLKFRIVGGNSGIQYRSKVVDEAGHVVAGYQADFEAGETYSGILYEEKGRGILAKRGEKVVLKQGAAPNKPEMAVEKDALGTTEEIQAVIKKEDWNEYKIVAKGGHLQHFINGKQSIDVTDETAEGAKDGVIAFQVHAGPPMLVQFKDVILKTDD